MPVVFGVDVGEKKAAAVVGIKKIDLLKDAPRLMMLFQQLPENFRFQTLIENIEVLLIERSFGQSEGGVAHKIVELSKQHNGTIIMENFSSNVEDWRLVEQPSRTSMRPTQEAIYLSALEENIPVYWVPATGTSTTCSACGFSLEENRQGEKFKCKSCNFQWDADFNAAKNIAKKFLSRCEKHLFGLAFGTLLMVFLKYISTRPKEFEEEARNLLRMMFETIDKHPEYSADTDLALSIFGFDQVKPWALGKVSLEKILEDAGWPLGEMGKS